MKLFVYVIVFFEYISYLANNHRFLFKISCPCWKKKSKPTIKSMILIKKKILKMRKIIFIEICLSNSLF